MAVRSRSRSPVYLAGALLFAAMAVVVYVVPIPGITYASAPVTPVTPAASTDSAAKEKSDQKESELARLQAELKNREDALKERETQVNSMLRDLSSQQSELEAIRKTAALYGAMPPYRSGPMMQSLELAVAVQVLRILDDDQAAAVLSYMSPDKAAQLVTELAKPVVQKTIAKE